MNIQVHTLLERPDLLPRIGELEVEAFPQFLNEDPAWLKYFPQVLDKLPEIQFFFTETGTSKLLAVLLHVAFRWDGRSASLPGYNALLEQAVTERGSGIHATALTGIVGLIPASHQKLGLSQRMFTAAAEHARSNGFLHYLVPLRPTLKHLYPNFSTADYLAWKQTDGRTFDPWIRSAENLNPEMLCIAQDSVVVTASIAQWQTWTGMRFPVSGQFVVPGAHQLLAVDLEADQGRYAEDHIWYRYPLATEQGNP